MFSYVICVIGCSIIMFPICIIFSVIVITSEHVGYIILRRQVFFKYLKHFHY